ncbi:MAG: hypothetical protein ACR2FM_05500 [Candidatus Saccharimonadales bacterium]
MDMPLTERRQIENEMIFRQANENVSDSIDEVDAMHIEDGNPHLIEDNNITLEFKCECSDENCEARIPIKLSTYQKVHVNRDTFIIKLKHQVESIEKVILTESTYSVVEKNNSTAEPTGELNITSINNT